MEQYLEKLGYKKVAALLVGIGLLIFIFAIVPLLFSKKVVTQHMFHDQAIIQPTPFETPDAQNSVGMQGVLKLYHNNGIHFQYPAGWKLSEQKIAAIGGTIIQMNTENDGNFTISITADTKIDFQNIKKELINNGYSKNPVMVSSIPSEKFVGIDPNNSRFEKIITYIKKGNQNYIISYIYPKEYSQVASESNTSVLQTVRIL